MLDNNIARERKPSPVHVN